MSFAGPPAFLLPPRPALRDWPIAGACAGLLLGLAELAFAAPETLSAPLALLALGSLALGVALAAAALGAVLNTLETRPSYSALVAWVAGLCGIAAAFPLVLPGREGSLLLGIGALLCAGFATGAATYFAARLADRCERAGVPAHALFVWGGVAIAIAAAERALLGAPMFGASSLALLAGLVLAGASIACALFYAARRRGASRPRASFGSLLRGVSLLALAAIFAPRALPWILADRELPPRGGAPAHILILAVGPAVGVSTNVRSLGALATWSGIRYEPRVADPERALEALLTLPDGAALVPSLAAVGYATAAFLADPAVAPPIAAREVDARPSARARLERELGWLAAAPWLVGPGRPALELLGLGGDLRTPAQLASDAQAWLLRRSATPTPFFLLVDFRRSGRFDAAESSREEEAAVALLEHLDQAGLAERTVVLLVRTGGQHEPPLRVVVRTPVGWSQDASTAVVERPVEANELGVALRQIASGDGVTPVVFPGVIGARG